MPPGLKRDLSVVARAVAFALACLMIAAPACDDPPEAPSSNIDVDEERDELDDEVDKTHAEANERIQKAEQNVPPRDAGPEDADARDE